MTSRRDFVLGLGAVVAASPAFARRSGWRRLFDGRSLEGWTRIGGANWRVEEGDIVADAGSPGFLVSTDRYSDFELRAEFWASDDANSGIFLRCQDPAEIAARNAYEVNIFDRRPDPAYGTGAIVDVAPVSPMPRAGGRWNIMTIRALGDMLGVALNGHVTVAGARDGRYREGQLALQYGAGIVRFRRVDVRPL
ncbi:hypothetical protein GCM10023232_01540 [Sphingosinicella ginsenosidimutans]|uniref:DUF1080 domain-containing protein n=1 Tax=Allosphingosinicella ginsenosidimutans TaxID=1176539 RepID=A0A5C6TUC1_9SPHN|nr:DUF1080 domain-containing protein [Sphingosinicella ginsenosidimutans]TXC64054.1 DUF1080 domain-containing protein [Sphingosinicella ginsenosidimutans]